MSKTATTDKERGNKPNATSCCGGPAPGNSNACCVWDADAKAAGSTGCGCSPAPQAGDPKAVCCV